MSITRHHPNHRMSQVVVCGSTVYLAGQVAQQPDCDVADQTRQILSRIDALLALAGTDKSQLLRANIWLADIGDFAAMNAVWDAWVDPANPPVRACVESRLARPALKVEIQVEAYTAPAADA